MNVHFIAIGGSIMHSLAIALKKAGHVVTGSDDQIYDPAYTKLKAQQLLPDAEGWDAKRIHAGLDAVILGMHAFEDNPELAKAQELGLPIYSFPDFIFSQSQHKHRIVVAGSYGKTTITSLIMHVLEGVGKSFDYLVGAQVPGFDNAVRLNGAPVIIMEGDEYLASKLDPRPKFLLYKPHMVVISGISWDHINVFPTEEAYTNAFAQLLKSMPKAADVIYAEKDDALSELLEAFTNPDIHYLHPYSCPEYRVGDESLEINIADEWRAIRLIGRHNMENISAAWNVCKLLGVERSDFLDQVATFQGAQSRLETIYEDSQIFVFKDFAHAPAKVQATVEAVRERFPDRNLIACVELHTFSSLNKNFLPHYKDSLAKADHRIVFVDPHALEKRRMPQISTDDLTAAFGTGDLIHVANAADLQHHIANVRTGKDICLMMSSGTFGGLNLMDLTE